MYRWLWLLLFPVFTLCSEGVTPSYSILKHREHQGVGYDTGFTSIDAMFNPIDFPNFFPFINARGHVFNDGHFASNLGLVGRYLSQNETWILGANLYYDYRNAKIFSPQQLGAGLELFYRKMTYRINGYRPFSVVKRKNGRAQVALANLEGEVERLFIDWKHFSLSGVAGMYYLMGRAFANRTFGKALGGQLRLSATLYRWIDLSVETTYDKIFNFNLQGVISLKIPLGSSRYHFQNKSFMKNLFRPVRRSEIIPLEKQHPRR